MRDKASAKRQSLLIAPRARQAINETKLRDPQMITQQLFGNDYAFFD